MSILPTSLAASGAAGSIAQGAAAKDSATAADNSAQAAFATIQLVGKGAAASPDRDAEGADHGAAFQRRTSGKENRADLQQPTEEVLAVSSPEPPSELDLLG